MTENQFLIVLCTVPDKDTGVKISNALTEVKLAAWCNIIPGLRPIFFWQGEVCDKSKLLLLIKTGSSSYEKLEEPIQNLHPYEVPEILALSIREGAESNLKWVAENVR